MLLFFRHRTPQFLASSIDGDPGLVFRGGYQLRSDLHDLSLQLVKLQLTHQRAEQHGGDGVGEPIREYKYNEHSKSN